MVVDFKNYRYIDDKEVKDFIPSYEVRYGEARIAKIPFVYSDEKRKEIAKEMHLDNPNESTTPNFGAKFYQQFFKAQYQKYAYNQEEFDRLMSERRYEEAANYLKKFEFKDPKEQLEHLNDIRVIEREGRKLSQIYSSINDKDIIEQIEFQNNVFVNGGLEKLKNNKYVERFAKLKNNIGGIDIHRIGLEFQPETQTTGGIDWLAKDNTENNIDKFYERSGLTEEILKENGVAVIKSDGKTELQFDKTNKLANKIIYNAVSFDTVDYAPHLWIYKNGTGTKDTKQDDYKYILFIQNLIKTTNDTKKIQFAKSKVDKRYYSSTVIPWITQELEDFAKQNPNRADYNDALQRTQGYIFDAVKDMGYHYKMYSNYNDDGSETESMVELNANQRQEIRNIISATAPKDMQISAMISNNKIGALITLNATKDKDGDITRPRIQVFVPGLLQEEAQRRLDSDTRTRSIVELNSMVDYGYEYKTYNNNRVQFRDGNFTINGKPVDKSDALREINKDMLMEDAKREIRSQFTNATGRLMRDDRYFTLAKLTAIRAALELYPQIQPIGNDGLQYNINGKLYTIAEMFDTIDPYNTQHEAYKILMDINGMYRELTKQSR